MSLVHADVQKTVSLLNVPLNTIILLSCAYFRIIHLRFIIAFTIVFIIYSTFLLAKKQWILVIYAIIKLLNHKK